MGYGQHQSFYLRDRWLSKAIKPLKDDDRFFYDKYAFEKIGLGKNMVQSLKFWLVATGVVKEEFNENRKKVHKLTPLGELINKYDKFVLFNDTASILHYMLSKEKEPSTMWYWFFNECNESLTTKDNLLNLFSIWVDVHEDKNISEKSLKRDVDCLVRLYTAGQNTDDPEEVIQSPLNKLELLTDKKGYVYKKQPRKENIGMATLMYVLLDYRDRKEIDSISVSEITSENGLWGKVFNMSRSEIIDALSELANHPKFPLRFVRTNNLDTIHLPDIQSLEFLEFEYKRKLEALV
ncbi:DUF4007 family protein [Guptibacillus hwajinpoensis]|uniref:DUF4007 family protein n=1 Tax=Guptibacillus hwajinpoensis TaxID=208199 RepID=UPI0024B3A303|nr:DUF4007 family protein [Pseudalkalibacillus hwajinpoensis]